MTTAICKCERCNLAWSCRAEEDPETYAIELVGDSQSCPECCSEAFEIVDVEYDED